MEGGVTRRKRVDFITNLAIKDVDFNKTRPFCATHPCTIVTGAIEPPTSVRTVWQSACVIVLTVLEAGFDRSAR